MPSLIATENCWALTTEPSQHASCWRDGPKDSGEGFSGRGLWDSLNRLCSDETPVLDEMLKTSDAFRYCSLFSGAFRWAPAELMSVLQGAWKEASVNVKVHIQEEQSRSHPAGGTVGQHLQGCWECSLHLTVLDLEKTPKCVITDSVIVKISTCSSGVERVLVFFFFLQSTVHILVLSVWGADPQFKVWGHFSPEKVMDCPMQGAICC